MTTPVALVTGASRGLGRGIAAELARRGFSVAVNFAGNEDAALETASLCADLRISGDQRFLPVRADIGEAADREHLLAFTVKEFGRIDALVNNAGVGPRVRADLTTMSAESFEEVLRTNLEGPFFLTQSVANYWLRERPAPVLPHGFVVLFNSSISAVTASVNRGEYCMSKAGVAMAAQLWAVRLAEAGVLVYELRPGIMATDMTNGVKEKYDALLDGGIAPQKRWGTPEDVGRAAGALCSGDFPYSTGSVIYIDGGFHLSRL